MTWNACVRARVARACVLVEVAASCACRCHARCVRGATFAHCPPSLGALARRTLLTRLGIAGGPEQTKYARTVPQVQTRYGLPLAEPVAAMGDGGDGGDGGYGQPGMPYKASTVYDGGVAQQPPYNV